MKRTLAAILTVLLLSMSGVSSMCQLNCGLRMGMANSHSVGVSSDKAPKAEHEADMSGMGDCGMQKPSDSSSPAVMADMSARCGHQTCTLQAAIPSEQRDDVAASSSGISYIVPEPFLFTAAAAIQAKPVRGPPPFRPSSPVSLHTTLRV